MSLERAIREATQPLWREIEHLRNEQARRNLDEIEMGNRGWISGAWQKDPLRLGYSGKEEEELTIGSASTGTNTMTGTAVPAGEIWILEAVAAVDLTNAPARIMIGAIMGGLATRFHRDENPVAGVDSGWTGQVLLEPGDQVSVQFHGVTSGDSLRARYSARRIDIDQ